MSYTVKLAIFPPFKAHVTYEAVDGRFDTIIDASRAAEEMLRPVTESELRELFPHLQVRSEDAVERPIVAIAVPSTEVHGYVVYDEAGSEVWNWTTLDAAVTLAAER